MQNDDLINWLLEGDVSIHYQAHRDLLGREQTVLQDRIVTEGWGAAYLSRRLFNGHWGRGFYQPKWTSTHYSILDLRNLCIAPTHPAAKETVNLILANHKSEDGGINPAKTVKNSDVCINGMALNYCSYFGADETKLTSIVDFLISQWMADGGFNCHSNQQGAVHSSLHTTLSVAEGIREYTKNGYNYRLHELQKAEESSKEFMLQHRLFRSDKTGNIIDKKMLMLSYPSRWRYDILRALDYFQYAGAAYDNRMNDAFDILMKKRRRDGKWPLQAKHPGETHFDMEKSGQPSRWNTLRVLRTLKHFDLET